MDSTDGQDLIRQARSYAAVLDEPNDPKTADLIITLMSEYGDDRVGWAIKIVQGYNSGSGLRQVGYFIGIL